MSAAAASREATRATPSSSSSPSPYSSSSSDDDVNDPDYRVNSSDGDPGYRAATLDDEDDNAAADVNHPMLADVEGIVSILRTKDDVDSVCKKYGVPKEQYTAHPAGDLRASSSPPPGAICLYAHALQAGMRVPLHPFFCDALAHFGIAPTQLAPNGWRIMAGFVVLCHYAGVPPSVSMFRHFFVLRMLNTKKKGGWYTFHTKDSAGLRFVGLPDSIKGWKHSFFFLSSPTPWPCPVEWGEPPKSSFKAPVLTGEEKRSVTILLRVHGGAPVDIRTYLRDNSLAAAMISISSPAPVSPSSTPTSACFKGMDPSVYGMIKTILVDKAAAAQSPASANKVKSEPDGDAPMRGKKRSLDEADGPYSVSARGSSVPAGARSPLPGYSPKRTPFPNGHDDDDSTDWEAARELLRGAAKISLPSPAPRPPLLQSICTRTSAGSNAMDDDMMKTMLAEKAAAVQAPAATKMVKTEPGSTPLCGRKRRLDEGIGEDGPPSSVLPNTPAATHGPPPGFHRTPKHFATDWQTARKLQQGAVLQSQESVFAANRPSDGVQLEEKLREREAEIAALRKQLEETEGELAITQRTLKAERESAQELAAVQELLGSEERVRRRAEHALEGYKRWKDIRERHGGHEARRALSVLAPLIS